MNLAETLRYFANIANKEILAEDKGHVDHPEDLVFLQDVDGAKRAIDSMLATAKNPKAITIKWDGYPALIFGRGTNGKFIIVDKHMFNKVDGSGRKIYSPEQFIAYDKARGVDRGELNDIIANIWPDLEKASKGTKGFFWGDMIFGSPLKETNGLYKFRANPKGIVYTVDADSDVGKLLEGKIAGIAVHQYIAPDAPEKAAQMSVPGKKVYPTDLAVSLNGTIGQLKNDTNVAIVPSAMPITPVVKIDKGLVTKAQGALNKYATDIQKLMNTAPQARNTFDQLFTTYINSRIKTGNLDNLADGFMDYVENRPMTDSMKKKIADHLNANKKGIIGIFTVWIALYNLKMSIVDQLAKTAEQSPVKGYLQSGQQSQEGFVSQGLKFVDRLGFSAQNLAGR
jgi:hypothetical protein